MAQRSNERKGRVGGGCGELRKLPTQSLNHPQKQKALLHTQPLKFFKIQKGYIYLLYKPCKLLTIPTIKSNTRRCITLFWKKKEIQNNEKRERNRNKERLSLL